MSLVITALACGLCSSAAARTNARPPIRLGPVAAAAPRTYAVSDAGGVGGRLLGVPAGSASLPGGLGGATPSLGGGLTGSASDAVTSFALSEIGASVAAAAGFVLKQTAHILGDTTTPRLTSTWFSNAYWRVAGIASILTLPFLFAASVQALIRSDLALLVRAAAAYLPIAMLTVAIAAPLTMLLLSASDQLAEAVSSAAGHDGANFLARLVGSLALLSPISSSPFLAFLLALFTVAGALMLWVELLIREAGVYVIVLMLPVVFAAFVWPARRIWAIRSVELLLALILSKFLIVAVLSLGGAALGHSVTGGLSDALAGVVLLVLAAFAPWALVRLIPLAEVAGAAAGGLRSHAGSGLTAFRHADALTGSEKDRWASRIAAMRRSAAPAEPSPGDSEAAGPRSAAMSRGAVDPGRMPEDAHSGRPGDGPGEPGSDAPDPAGPYTDNADDPSEPNAAKTPDPAGSQAEAGWIRSGPVFLHWPGSPKDPSGEDDW